MNAQLPLALRWPAQQRFDSYVSGDNAVALGLLRDAALSPDASWVFVAGAAGVGKTHLLIAACAEADVHGRSAQYLPLRRATAAQADVADTLRAFGGSDLLALDDVDAIAGDAAAEHALFDLYNRCRVEKSTILFTAAAPPAQLGIGLPDLVSRLSACAQAALRPLADHDRREALRQRAQARGLTLDDAVLDWLFARTQRDLGSLTALLDRLDRESLAAQRRITVPFLRQMLDGRRNPAR
ncbi:MAG TPA: DnaA regulatory inactivator Hda [Rudaea sp.]|nr:DnaA regulatory inactivator Hda [Rudaea sp.]